MNSSAKVSISLPAGENEYLQALVASGRYPSIDAALGAALRLLQERDSQRDAAREELTELIEEGLEAARQGHFCTEEQLLADLEELGRQRRAATG